MIKRGPDGAGLWISPDRRVGLAHRRLAIIDLSDAGAQPMANADGSLEITFNGEIYNYRELRRELEAKGYVFRTNSDTEVLLHLYADRGENMVHALRGMYAFGLWDQARQGLFLVRDPFGIKPFTSQTMANHPFCLPGEGAACRRGNCARRVPAGYAGFPLGLCARTFTLYRAIRALPAGSGSGSRVRARGPNRPFLIRDEIAVLRETARPATPHEYARCCGRG
jgi:asparagine synthase (glutamine-hydrolysing)